MCFACLYRQEEDSSDDDWNHAAAASKVLMALSETIGNDILPIFQPKFYQAIMSEKWRVKMQKKAKQETETIIQRKYLRMRLFSRKTIFLT